eukprot:1590078-Lingulodinium_polyedra.AAC.1
MCRRTVPRSSRLRRGQRVVCCRTSNGSSSRTSTSPCGACCRTRPLRGRGCGPVLCTRPLGTTASACLVARRAW